jgi:glycosyltransferase involved in cell wall biosynthesis
MKRYPIKVLFNVLADASNINAQSLNARDIALRLDPLRFESSMFLGREPDPRLLKHPGIRLIALPRRYGSFVVLVHLVWGNYDVVVYPPYVRFTRHHLHLSILGKRKKLIMPVEGPPVGRRDADPQAYDHRYCQVLTQSDVVVPISKFVKDCVEQEVGIKASLSIPVGVDTSFFIPVLRNDSKRVHVSFVGRLIQRKGPDLVLEAARLFSSVDFSLIGTAYGSEDGLFASELKRRTSEEGLTNIRFLGKLSQAEVREVMHRSDIFLLPSRIEGIPKVTLEAAATGLPCVIFDDYRTPSVLDGITGFQVKSFEEMVARLRELIESRDLRIRMGQAAVQHVKQFDWNLVTRQWEQVLLDVLPDKT